MPNSKTFCPLPFFQVVVRTDGTMNPCCIMKGRANIKNSSLLEYWHGDELNQIRDTMLAGSTDIPGCTICYHNERSIGKSTRTEALNDYKFFNEQHYTKLIDYYGCLTKQSPSILEMHLGNTCNLKCLTCRPEDSSMFLQENKTLGISNHNQSDYMLDSSIINDTIDSVIDDLAVLDLRGGESLLIPTIKKKLQSMPIDSCNTKTLRVQTNGTLLNDAWKDIFKKFQSVEIMISIDAFGEDNAYIRYPADWSRIEATVDYFKSIHCKIYINCTISNLNFLLLDKLLHWAHAKEIYFHFATLDHPTYYHYSNLPHEIFEQAKVKLLKWTDFYPALTGLLSTVATNDQWKEFCSIINKRDTHRKNSIFDILPELKTHWYA